MLSSVVPAMMIALFLTLVARPFAVFILLTPFKASFAQQTLVSWAGLRGAASIVFAIIAYTSPAYTETDIFHIVFCIVLFSILIQGSFIPLFAKWLNMIDTNEDVLKTFTDYSEEIPIQFIQFEIKHSHPWAEKQIKDVVLPPGTLIVLQKRKNKNIAPRGFSVIKPGDVLVLSASAFENIDGVSLSEIIIDRRSKWLNKALSEIDLDSDKLVIMIMRGKKTIIPQGNTVLRQGDIMVINTTV